MTTTQRDTDYYIDTALRLADLVAANADAVNEQRQIPTRVANAVADAGFFRLLMPRALGGAQLDHPDFLRIVRIFAEADGSVGWSINQNNVFATNSTRMNDRARAEIYADPRAVITNGPPTAQSKAIAVDGGYLLSGRWNFSTARYGLLHRHGARLAELVAANDAPPMRRPINYVDELRTRTNP